MLLFGALLLLSPTLVATCSIYVSVLGNPSNSGLSPQFPVDNIAQALSIVTRQKSLSCTIQIAAGTYDAPPSLSFSNAGKVWSTIDVVGAGANDTLLDCKLGGIPLECFGGARDGGPCTIGFSRLALRNCGVQLNAMQRSSVGVSLSMQSLVMRNSNLTLQMSSSGSSWTPSKTLLQNVAFFGGAEAASAVRVSSNWTSINNAIALVGVNVTDWNQPDATIFEINAPQQMVSLSGFVSNATVARVYYAVNATTSIGQAGRHFRLSNVTSATGSLIEIDGGSARIGNARATHANTNFHNAKVWALNQSRVTVQMDVHDSDGHALATTGGSHLSVLSSTISNIFNPRGPGAAFYCENSLLDVAQVTVRNVTAKTAAAGFCSGCIVNVLNFHVSGVKQTSSAGLCRGLVK